MAELVILGAFLGIGKDFIGFSQFFELVLSSLVAWIFIGMILDSLFTEGLFDFNFGGVLMDLQNFIIITFFSGSQNNILLMRIYNCRGEFKTRPYVSSTYTRLLLFLVVLDLFEVSIDNFVIFVC